VGSLKQIRLKCFEMVHAPVKSCCEKTDKGIVCITRSLIKSKRQGGSLLAAIMKNKIRLMGIIGVGKHLYYPLPTL